MNFLQIAKKVDELAQTQGVISSVTPTNSFQTGLIERVRTTNHDLHTYRKDWSFNYTEVQAPLSPTVNSFSDSTVGHWESVVYNNQFIQFVPYSTYLRSDWTSPMKPHKGTLKPDNQLIFNTVDDNYIVQCNGYLKPDTLTENTDIPRIPEEFHYLIVYGALISLGSSLSLYNIITEYLPIYNSMLGSMMRSYLPSRNLKRRPLV